jgi:hypothetical protein
MPGEIAYRIACCEAAAGEREAAVAALAGTSQPPQDTASVTQAEAVPGYRG